MSGSRSVCFAAALVLSCLLMSAPAFARGAWVKHGQSGQAYAWSPGGC